MVVQVTLEFTDAQWALIEDNYPKYPNADGALSETITAEDMSRFLMLDIRIKTTAEIQNKASLAQVDAFDVQEEL